VLFPNNNLIESAGIAMNGYTPIDVGRDLPGHRQSSVYECFAVQWALALVRKQAVVGVLDEDVFFGHVGWDDIDNCLAVRKKGWKVVYCGVGAAYHSPRATRGDDSMQAAVKNLVNAHTFYKRNGFWDLFLKTAPAATLKEQIMLLQMVIPTLSGLDKAKVSDDLSQLEDGIKAVGR
jgi:GT2 family glycosyltransferase